jgi:hypothetical protein
MKRTASAILIWTTLASAACSGTQEGSGGGETEAPDLPSVQAPEGGAPVSGSENATGVKAIRVTGGGPVIQILPGPFPFPDSAAPVIQQRPEDQRAKLEAQVKQGPYSNNVAPIAGNFSFVAWDRGSARDSVAGTAEFTTQDGAEWRLTLQGVQTRDVPLNPRFGGVIIPLVYHGTTNNHTPLIPTNRSEVALWSFGELRRNGEVVDDSAMVHVMMTSRTRGRDFKLECYNCTSNPVEELQLQIAPRDGKPKLPAPGGVLFVNWQKSSFEHQAGGS